MSDAEIIIRSGYAILVDGNGQPLSDKAPVVVSEEKVAGEGCQFVILHSVNLAMTRPGWCAGALVFLDGLDQALQMEVRDVPSL